MHRLIHKIVFIVLGAVVIVEGAFSAFEIAKTRNFRAEISESKREQETLQMQIAALERGNQKYEEEIEQLKREEENLIVQKDQANRLVYDLARSGYALRPSQASQEVVLSGLRYIHVIAPKGGEVLCLGKEYVVRWESNGISTVQITFRGNGIGGAILEFDYPANLNETGDPFEGTYLWKVGKAGEADGQDLMAPAGGGYTFSLVSLDGATDASQAVVAKSDAPFSIVQCEN